MATCISSHGKLMDSGHVERLLARSWTTWREVNIMAKDKVAHPAEGQDSPPEGQVMLAWNPDGQLLLCVPEMRPDEQVSRAMLLMTAIMVKVENDEAWGDALIAEVFPSVKN